MRVAWANVGRGNQSHDLVLNLCLHVGIDVCCIQEPWTGCGTLTVRPIGWQMISPVISWDSQDTLEEERPRVLTYIRVGAGLHASIIHPRISRDLLWVNVNGYSILNFYRQPQAPEVIAYLTSLEPPNKCLIGGDLNARHDVFEPGTTSSRGGGKIVNWMHQQELAFIGEAGAPTHKAGHVLDVTLSNIPFAETRLDHDLWSMSDHYTQVTLIPERGRAPTERRKYMIPIQNVKKFVGLCELNFGAIKPLPRATNCTKAQLNDHILEITKAYQDSVQGAGKVTRETAKISPWWTAECNEALQRHYRERTPHGEPPSNATREFRAVIRRAKREYWQKKIDECKTDKALYALVGWHKLSYHQTDTPLKLDDGQTITDPLEKAETLRREVLSRFTAADDLPTPPEEADIPNTPQLPWKRYVTREEVERCTIGVSSTSPGIDQMTVKLLKLIWDTVEDLFLNVYQRCLDLNYFPDAWKTAEVVMIPKVGRADKTSVRSMRPIALLSVFGKGFERLIARRVAYTAMESGIISPQHCGSLPKRSAMDLVATCVHKCETAWHHGKSVTLVTMDVKGAFDALLKNRLLWRMLEQGWPYPLIELVYSFLTDRKIRVRLGKVTTPDYSVECGTPQGSPLSGILYCLYLAPILNQDREQRFGYADDICLMRADASLKETTRQLEQDIQQINEWGEEHKIAFAPEKLEMIHLTRRRNAGSPSISVAGRPEPLEAVSAVNGKTPALKWLGVYLDRRLNFRRHISERNAAARKVANHLKSLANTAHGPPAASVRKAVITCILPAILYGTEAWYEGRFKNPRSKRVAQADKVSTKVGFHVTTIQRTLAIAARAVLPAWKTTPVPILLREAALPSAMVALEEAKLRFALRLQTVDNNHPLVEHMKLRLIPRGRGAGGLQAPITRVQRQGQLLPAAPRPALIAPHFSTNCLNDPTQFITKARAAKQFIAWWEKLSPRTVTVFSDGSEQKINGERVVTYGYVIYQGTTRIASGSGALHQLSHVFDAEAVGAWRGLQHAIKLGLPGQQKIVMCIDSTSVIWCLRGCAPVTSQWAFLECHNAMEIFNISIKWSPGHQGILGNETADALADRAAKSATSPYGKAAEPTASGIRSIAKVMLSHARQAWWHEARQPLSKWYKRWGLEYATTKAPKALLLPRPTLARLIAIRSMHGDFKWYHEKFNHLDATLECSCQHPKTPDHIAHCRKSQRTFNKWPLRPVYPPSNTQDGIDYLAAILSQPLSFEALLSCTRFYSAICP